MKKFYTLLLFSLFISLNFSLAQGFIFTSEIHYDDGANSSADDDEMIEVYIENPQPAVLSDYSVVLYNGSSSQLKMYDTKTLDVFTATPTPNGVYYFYNYTVNGGSIQNGAPDGWAVAGPGSTLIEFLSYEGTFTPIDGPAAGVMSTDIGVAENGSTVEGTSIQNDGFGNWTAGVTASPGTENAGNLPIELESFEATLLNSNSVKLEWITSQEISNSHFEVQSSENGHSFRTIAKVNGAGYSSEAITYNFNVEGLKEGVHYFRLKQVDFDNKSETFEMKSIEIRNEKLVQIYPTQVVDQINVVNVSEGQAFRIYNLRGQVVLEANLENGVINVGKLVQGSYFIRVNETVLQFVKL